MIERRAFLTGFVCAFAVPAIVRAASLMPVKNFLFSDGLLPWTRETYTFLYLDLQRITREAFHPILWRNYNNHISPYGRLSATTLQQATKEN